MKRLNQFKRISQNRAGKLFVVVVTIVAIVLILSNERVSVQIEDSFDLDRRQRSINEKRKAFLLMAGYRGGSTLTGEMFNRNKNILYYFGNLV